MLILDSNLFVQERDKLEGKKKEINKYISVLDGRLDSMNHGYTLLTLALL